MRRLTANYLAVVAVISATASLPDARRHDPFVLLSPDVVVSASEQAELDADQPFVRVVAGRDGFLSLSAIVPVNVGGDRVVAWARSVERLQKGKYIPEIGRFSDPPRLEDLRDLTIAPDDLDALERCRPGNCGLKLSVAEIQRVQGVKDRARLERTFRQIIVDRAAAYVTHGDAAAPPFHDHKTAVQPQEAFAGAVQRVPFFARSLPCFAEFLHAYPRLADVHVRESFLYWSKETLGLKPIISITHFSVGRFDSPGMPEVAVAAKQVYATHYKEASFTVTALTGTRARPYLVYVQRSRIDGFQGLFGGVVRRIVERRVKAVAPDTLRGLRKRLESGDPPSQPTSPAVN